MEKPPYLDPKNPKKRYKRRAPWHDYRAPGNYMITINKKENIPVFSEVKEASNRDVYCDYKPMGRIIFNQINAFNMNHPEARISHRAIMPDHLHFRIEVKEYLKDSIGLGKLINQLESRIRREYLAKFPDAPIAGTEESVFEYGFNDTIIWKRGQLDKVIKYIKDNPRKHMIMKKNPDLFSKRNQLVINGEAFMALGNLFLLRNPDIEAVRFSRKYSKEEWEAKKSLYEKTIDNGGVLVSPFINEEEKKFLRLAIEEGKGVILIQDRSYGDRTKPGGRLFDLCAEGRLLIIAINKDEDCREGKLSREICLRMNDIAAQIAYNRNKYSFR